MPVLNVELHEKKKIEIMENCFACLAREGLGNVGIRGIAKECGYTSGNLYVYFKDIDDLIIQSTEHCMSKVEDDFMARAPMNPQDIEKFIDETPYWTAKTHGEKYRLMYQVYTSPKYREYGKKFFEGVNLRYSEYAKMLSDKIGIFEDILRPMIFVLIRASVHYALYEDEFYLQDQIRFLKQSIKLFAAKQ